MQSKQVTTRGGTSLVGAKRSSGTVLVWDDTTGPVWAYIVQCGHFSYLRGLVVADTWEDAYSCCQDEIMEDPDPDLVGEYEAECNDAELPEDVELPEGMGYRGSGVPSNDGMESCYYWAEPMGEDLVPVTRDLLEREGIELDIRR